MTMAYPHGDPKEPVQHTAPTKILRLPLRPTTDAYISCIVCHQANVEFEFWSRTPGTRQFQGLHQACAETMGEVKAIV